MPAETRSSTAHTAAAQPTGANTPTPTPSGSGAARPRVPSNNLFNNSPAGVTAFGGFGTRQKDPEDPNITQLSSTFERLVSTLVRTFDTERRDLAERLQTERELDRAERKSFRSDMFDVLDRMITQSEASGNSRAVQTTTQNAAPATTAGATAPTPAPVPAPNGTSGTTIVVTPAPPAPPPRDLPPHFTVNCSATHPVWKTDLKAFSGEARDVQTHLATCELMFKAERTPLTDEQKILVSLKHCTEGVPREWYENCIHLMSSGAWDGKTWEEYKTSFMNTFGDPFLTAEGNRLLSSAVQRKDETTARFLMRFDGYRSMAGQMDAMFDLAMIRMLRDRLPPKVIAKVGDHIVNYEEFKAIVIKQDSKLRESERSSKHFESLRALDVATNAPPTQTPTSSTRRLPFFTRTSTTNTGSQTTPTNTSTTAGIPTATPTTAPAPASTNVTATTPAPTPLSMITCFNCGQRGHKKVECPQPACGGRIGMVLEEAAEALVLSGNEECAANLVQVLTDADDKDFPTGEH